MVMTGTMGLGAKTVETAGAAVLAGKYLTFTLADEAYAFEILKVQEIIKMQTITQVPRMPEYVSGVINLRGKVIPVIELRSRFGLSIQAATPRTCIIVLQVQREGVMVVMGVVVDEVSEVLDVAGDEIEPTPQFGSAVDTGFILGMAKARGTVIMLLNIDRVLSSGELNRMIRHTAGSSAMT